MLCFGLLSFCVCYVCCNGLSKFQLNERKHRTAKKKNQFRETNFHWNTIFISEIVTIHFFLMYLSIVIVLATSSSLHHEHIHRNSSDIRRIQWTGLKWHFIRHSVQRISPFAPIQVATATNYVQILWISCIYISTKFFLSISIDKLQLHEQHWSFEKSLFYCVKICPQRITEECEPIIAFK